MGLKNRVCSFELAKKIKELGVKQNSHWYWISTLGKWKIVDREEVDRLFSYWKNGNDIYYNRVISAFTFIELYEIIYNKGLSFGLLNRLSPEVVLTYTATFLIMELEREKNKDGRQKEGDTK